MVYKTITSLGSLLNNLAIILDTFFKLLVVIIASMNKCQMLAYSYPHVLFMFHNSKKILISWLQAHILVYNCRH